MERKTSQHLVLIVDDDPNVTRLLAKSLSKLGNKYLIDTANGGEEALEKASDTPYDLLIVDYQMPEMNGLDLITAMRRLSPQTQVVLMTAHGSKALRDTADTIELDGYLDKPFTLTQIRRIVREAVARSENEIGPFQSGERTTSDVVHDQLVELQANTGARCIMLISNTGYPIDVVGAGDTLDISSVGVLVAANFAAAVELSRLLGNVSVFKSSYHEGPDYNIYAYDIDGDVLLAVVFDNESRPGTVWFYTKQTATALEPELALSEETEDLERKKDLSEGLTALNEDLDHIFEQVEEQSQG